MFRTRKGKKGQDFQVVSHVNTQMPPSREANFQQMSHKDDNECTSSLEEYEEPDNDDTKRPSSSKSMRSFCSKLARPFRKGKKGYEREDSGKSGTKEKEHKFPYDDISKKSSEDVAEEAAKLESIRLDSTGNYMTQANHASTVLDCGDLTIEDLPYIKERNINFTKSIGEMHNIEVKLDDKIETIEEGKNIQIFATSSTYSDSCQDQVSTSGSSTTVSSFENEMKEEHDRLNQKSSPISPDTDYDDGKDNKQNVFNEFRGIAINSENLSKIDQIIKENANLQSVKKQQEEKITKLELLLSDYEDTDVLLTKEFPEFRKTFRREKVIEQLVTSFKNSKKKIEKFDKIQMQNHFKIVNKEKRILQQGETILEKNKMIEDLKRNLEVTENSRNTELKKLNGTIKGYLNTLECLSLLKDCCLEVLIKMTQQFENNLNDKMLEEFKCQLRQISSKCSVDHLQDVENIEWIKEDINTFFLEDTYNKFIKEIVQNYSKNLSENCVLAREYEILLAKYQRQRQILKETKENLIKNR